MLRIFVSLGAGILVALLAAAPPGIGGEVTAPVLPRAALTVQAIRPDEQLAQALALFEGTTVPNPAAALAAWRRVTGRHEALSKAAQAVIALLNPEMVGELRTLCGAGFALGFDAAGRPAGDGPWWIATLPSDDGTFAALATALALTEGAALPPRAGAGVDRLGPPGAPLMARESSGGVALASDVAVLDEAVRQLRTAGEDGEAAAALPDGGWVARLDVAALGADADGRGGLARRRLAAGLAALGCRQIEATAGLEGDALELVVIGRYDDKPTVVPALDPAWLDWVPAERAAAALAFAVDEAGATWDAAFAAADRVERADPARGDVTPLRARLSLLALAAGVRPEADLWPLLRGVTACITTNAAGDLDGALVALHAADAEAARRIARGVVRPLAARLGARGGDGQAAGPAPAPDPADAPMPMGRVFGRPLELAVRGASVLVAWGDGLLAASLAAGTDPCRSAAGMIRAAWAPADRPQRAGAFWPGRLRLGVLAPAGSPLAMALADSPPAMALADSPPVVWWGTTGQATTHDRIRWNGLRALVHRFLARLPLEPSPERPEPR